MDSIKQQIETINGKLNALESKVSLAVIADGDYDTAIEIKKLIIALENQLETLKTALENAETVANRCKSGLRL